MELIAKLTEELNALVAELSTTPTIDPKYSEMNLRYWTIRQVLDGLEDLHINGEVA